MTCTPDPAAVECAAHAMEAAEQGIGDNDPWYSMCAEAVIVALVTEGHMHPADCEWKARFDDSWNAMRQAVAEGPEAQLAEAVALLRRMPLHTSAQWSELNGRVRDFLAAHGGPDAIPTQNLGEIVSKLGVARHVYTVDVFLHGVEKYPCIICGGWRQDPRHTSGGPDAG